MRRRVATVGIALAALGAIAAAPAPGSLAVGSLLPDGVPDRGPVLAEPIARGAVVLAEPTTQRPTRKAIDGDLADWVAEPSRIGGTSVWGAGEHVYSDFLFDAHGADDGADRDRLEQFAGALYVEDRASRVDQLLRTSGSQLGVPEPFGAPDEYGDVDGGLEVADLTEVRWAADRPGRTLSLLARVANLTDTSRLGVLVLADLDGATPAAATPVGLRTGLTTERFDRAVLLTAGGATGTDLATGAPLDLRRASVAVSADGWDNALEASLPTALLGSASGVLDLGVVAG